MHRLVQSSKVKVGEPQWQPRLSCSKDFALKVKLFEESVQWGVCYKCCHSLMDSKLLDICISIFLGPSYKGWEQWWWLFLSQRTKRKGKLWCEFFFLQYCAFHLFGNPLLLKHDPPVYFKQSKKLLSLSSNVLVCFFTQYKIKSFFAFFCIIQDSARDYDSQDRRKLLVSNY